jgi:hypothetical protein
MTVPLDAVVIGAGPYGLAVAAELRRAGANVQVFGETMSFWMRHMPKGMCLRSSYPASTIGDPKSEHSLDAFAREVGRPIHRPVPLDDFIAYGHWFQTRAVPDVDRRAVTRLETHGGGFRLILTGGEPVEARRVIVAAGIAPFAKRPAIFDGLPSDLASHSVEHADLASFARRRVVVVGGGQSAIEFAVLLQENGADVEVIMRSRSFQWVGRAPREGLVGPLLFDRTDVGPAGVSHLVAHPMFLRRLPRAIQRDSIRRALAPGASLWLRPRLQDLPISRGRHVAAVARQGDHLNLRLDDGSSRAVDHVLLATGYRVDIRRYPFLAPDLVAQVRCVDGHPVLDAGLQTSLPGLHFVGAPAMHSFGPLLRFVSGTEFAARMVTRHVTSGVEARSAAGRAVELQRAAR